MTVVDLCRGVIREHALWDAHNQLIARASLSEYYRDMKSNALLARKFVFEWPQAGLGMTMTLSEIDVNPERIPSQTWKVPHIPDNPIRDMDQ